MSTLKQEYLPRRIKFTKSGVLMLFRFNFVFIEFCHLQLFLVIMGTTTNPFPFKIPYFSLNFLTFET